MDTRALVVAGDARPQWHQGWKQRSRPARAAAAERVQAAAGRARMQEVRQGL